MEPLNKTTIKGEPSCGSWIVIHRRSGTVILETFSEKVADAVNKEVFEVITAYEHLARLNDYKRSNDWGENN